MRDPTGHSGEGARARDAMRGGGGVTLRQGASPANGARPSEETEALSI